VDVIIQEVNHALNAGLYYLSIMMALALPDICAALESSNGETTGQKYQAWCNKWVTRYPTLTSIDLYSMRCGVVHQGRYGHAKMQYARVLFTIPNINRNTFHNNVINDALNLDAVIFCRDMIESVGQWYAAKRNEPSVVANLPLLVQFRDQGLAPYMVGMPLIA